MMTLVHRQYNIILKYLPMKTYYLIKSVTVEYCNTVIDNLKNVITCHLLVSQRFTLSS